MSEFFQQLINGLSLGAIYALIALGYTMVHGVLRFINFAHSEVFVLTVLLLIGLRFVVMSTRIGTAMRALSFNPQAAALVGINNNQVISFTFALGSALAGAGGILYAQNYPSIDPLMGVLPGLKAFVAAVLGGIGNIPGAALGGLTIGAVETWLAGTRLSTYRDAIGFATLIASLLFRPSSMLVRS